MAPLIKRTQTAIARHQNVSGPGRTIIVGDVHGCSAELETLLDRVAFTSGDRLVFVGDVLARGPDSLGVLDIIRQTGAILVRGNHEQKVLDARAPDRRTFAGAPSDLHRAIARTLRPVDWSLLESSPVHVAFNEHELVVVHAGVVPGTALEHQDFETMMRIRTIALNRFQVDARSRRGRGADRNSLSMALRTAPQAPTMRSRQIESGNVLWGTRWVGPPHIVFGHNAAPGLQLHPWATGLDTGCVYGGRLTALVLGAGRKVPRDLAARRALLVSVPARRVWHVPDKSRSAVTQGDRA